MKKLVAILLLTSSFSVARSQEKEPPEPPKDSDIRLELAKQMKIVAAALRAKGEPSIAIGAITGPPGFPSSSGAGLALILAEELRKNKIEVRFRADLGLTGKYYLSSAPWGDFLPGKNRLAVALELSVVDIQDKPFANLKDMRCILAGEGPVMTLLAPPVALPDASKKQPGNLYENRDLAMKAAIAKPSSAIKDNILQSSSDSPFAVQVLVDGKAISIDDEGLAYLKLHPEKPFAVKLINKSDKEAAVRLTIDGIDAFAFSEDRVNMGPRKGEPRFSVFVVESNSAFVVEGWHISGKQSVPFQMKGYGKNAKEAVAFAKQNDPVGTITARFSAAWEKGSAPPPGEPAQRRKVGDPVVEPEAGPDSQTGAIERQVGVVRSLVTARFDRK